MTTRFNVCNCNRTMPLAAGEGAALGTVLGSGPLAISTQLCRREAGVYLDALQGADRVVVGCTQEQGLFAELAQRKAATVPVRFVNLRESGGWGAQAKQALPKMAALLAAAALPDPEPVPEVNYESAGSVLLIGPPERALPWARRLAPQLDVSVLLTSGRSDEALMERLYPVFSGEKIRIAGWLGAFRVRWEQANPIDLELCTRCNACVAACPEGAIGLDYQIDAGLCQSHRACVAACGAIGAIDFARSASARSGEFDLILDLSERPLLTLQQPPQGYFAAGADIVKQAEQALQLTQLVGRFSKPVFLSYNDRICAHSRNRKPGCTACIDVCSTAAISDNGDHVKADPYLCAGCGACTTVCPTGALSYAYPRATDLGLRIRTMLAAYARAGGQHPALLLHSQERGAELILELGRLAGAGALQGVPARVMPIDLHHVPAVGIDVWLSAIAYGASNVLVLGTGEEASQYIDALEQQIEIAQSILTQLGYAGRHIALLRAKSAQELDTELRRVQPGQTPAQRAGFHLAANKRNTLDLALGHLHKHAPAAPVPACIALPTGSPFGAISVNTAACTLCMACVGACPAGALTDNPDLPQLRFIEKNCVQCNLCASTCPEHAIALTPRLSLTAEARQPVVLNEAQPFCCIRCGKPFGTLQIVENMARKLALHGAFAGNPERLRMCADCRVVDMMENRRETSILDMRE
ncbi:MAG TPA: 4Fe-4S binding protein [Burkholderiaceae bacterium]|nr:4Fe-4S binding protein [Burkholderiaceae bacterium]